MPCADLVIAGSTEARPAMVLPMMGSNAYNVSAAIAGAWPSPKIGTKRPKSASEGIVNMTEAELTISGRTLVLR